jgi:hypothetical protein
MQTMHDWDISSHADAIVGILLAVAIVVILI